MSEGLIIGLVAWIFYAGLGAFAAWQVYNLAMVTIRGPVVATEDDPEHVDKMTALWMKGLVFRGFAIMLSIFVIVQVAYVESTQLRPKNDLSNNAGAAKTARELNESREVPVIPEAKQKKGLETMEGDLNVLEDYKASLEDDAPTPE